MMFMNEHIARRRTIGNTRKAVEPERESLSPASTSLSVGDDENKPEGSDRNGGRSGNFKRRKIDPITSQLSSLTSSLCQFILTRTSISQSQTTEMPNNRSSDFAAFITRELNALPESIQKKKKAQIMAVLYE